MDCSIPKTAWIHICLNEANGCQLRWAQGYVQISENVVGATRKMATARYDLIQNGCHKEWLGLILECSLLWYRQDGDAVDVSVLCLHGFPPPINLRAIPSAE